MNRLVAILLILWLPLLAAAGGIMPACGGHESAHRLALSERAVSAAHHAAPAAPTVLPAAVSMALDTQALDLTSSVDTAQGSCGYCVVACAAHGPATQVHSLLRHAGAGPLLHGAERFSSVAAVQALKPPITAA